MRYRLESSDGTDFGSWEGGSPEEAFAAMVEAAGATDATDADGQSLSGSIDDWYITLEPPTPDEIREARKRAGHSQTKAATTLYRSLRAWQHWEAGVREMEPALWELYLIKTQQ